MCLYVFVVCIEAGSKPAYDAVLRVPCQDIFHAIVFFFLSSATIPITVKIKAQPIREKNIIALTLTFIMASLQSRKLKPKSNQK